MKEWEEIGYSRIAGFLFLGNGTLGASKDDTPSDTNLIMFELPNNDKPSRIITSQFQNTVIESLTKNYYYFVASNESMGKFQLKKIDIPTSRNTDQLEFVETERYIYIIYGNVKSNRYVDLFLKNTELGPNLLAKHMPGRVVAVLAQYSSILTDNTIIVEKHRPGEAEPEILKVHLVLMNSGLICTPKSLEKTQFKIKVKTDLQDIDVELNYFLLDEDIKSLPSTPSIFWSYKNIIILIVLTLFVFIILCVFYIRSRRISKISQNYKNMDSIINGDTSFSTEPIF